MSEEKKQEKKQERKYKHTEQERKKAREERKKYLESIAKQDINSLVNEETEPSEREYARQFKQTYNAIRKGSTSINARRTLKQITNKQAVTEMATLLKKFIKIDISVEQENEE